MAPILLHRNLITQSRQTPLQPLITASQLILAALKQEQLAAGRALAGFEQYVLRKRRIIFESCQVTNTALVQRVVVDLVLGLGEGLDLICGQKHETRIEFETSM